MSDALEGDNTEAIKTALADINKNSANLSSDSKRCAQNLRWNILEEINTLNRKIEIAREEARIKLEQEKKECKKKKEEEVDSTKFFN